MSWWDLYIVLPRLLFPPPPPTLNAVIYAVALWKPHTIITSSLIWLRIQLLLSALSLPSTYSHRVGHDLNTQSWENTMVSTIGPAWIAAYLPTGVVSIWAIFHVDQMDEQINSCLNQKQHYLSPGEWGISFFPRKGGSRGSAETTAYNYTSVIRPFLFFIKIHYIIPWNNYFPTLVSHSSISLHHGNTWKWKLSCWLENDIFRGDFQYLIHEFNLPW